MNQFIDAHHYITSDNETHSLPQLMTLFDRHILPDGVRQRAYLKLIWTRKNNRVEIASNQAYFQSAGANVDDGGKTRQFAAMDPAILELPVMKNILQFNTRVIQNFAPLSHHSELTLGLHFIRYHVNQYGASYSSPDGLHQDDEPLVFVHLLDLSPNAIGGDNLIAALDTRRITNVIRLEKPLDTLMLTRDYYHAVTPLGARYGSAKRDVILFTVEPSTTQVAS